MKAKYGNTWLALGGLEGTSGANWNGTQVNDDLAFFRAAARSFTPRGGRETVFGFRVGRGFDTEALAAEFCGLHFGQLPVQGDLLLTDEESTFALTLADAVLESVRIADVIGTFVVVEYSFRGGLFTGSETVPDEDDIDADGNDTMKLNVENLSLNDETKAIVFITPFGGVPRKVNFVVEAPGSSPGVGNAGVRSVSASGFTAVFSAAIPDTGYKIRWEAQL